VQQFDILVVGGGLVGSAFVRAIATANLKILVIDKLPISAAYNPSLDNRGLAISYTSKEILTDLKVWQDLAPMVYPINTVHVSEQNSFGFTKLSATQYNLPALGYVLSSNNLGQSLIQGLENLPNVTVMRPCILKKNFYDMDLARWVVDLDSQQVQVKLIVAAEGSNSTLGQKIADVAIKDYQQTAIVTNVSTTQKNITTAYERFVESGVLALLPFGPQQCKCVWTVSNHDLKRLTSITDAEFIMKLQTAFGFRCGIFTHLSDRMTFPLRAMHSNQLYSTNMVLLGNSANTLHPVAAQGFNMGLRDAVVLAKLLCKINFNESKINFTSVLQNYASLRLADHNKTREFTNLLLGVFASDLPLAKFTRGGGLVAAHLIQTINRKIVQRGLGRWI